MAHRVFQSILGIVYRCVRCVYLCIFVYISKYCMWLCGVVEKYAIYRTIIYNMEVALPGGSITPPPKLGAPYGCHWVVPQSVIPTYTYIIICRVYICLVYQYLVVKEYNNYMQHSIVRLFDYHVVTNTSSSSHKGSGDSISFWHSCRHPLSTNSPLSARVHPQVLGLFVHSLKMFKSTNQTYKYMNIHH